MIKEFYTNGKLKFECEYLNGLITGKGKEYDKNGKLIIEGEYLYGRRLKGKYYIKERLEYEGDYIIKKYNGKGYDEKGNVIYELKNGTGKVKVHNDYDYLIFEGDYLNGLKNRRRKEFDYDGKLIFEGDYLNGKRIQNKK